jgi:uracil-DNA glycosylase
LTAGDRETTVSPARAPVGAAIEELRALAAGCRACPLWERATQAVFGEGPPHAPLVLVGEQPGDREDIEGHPFVGPAGRVLDEAIADAGLDREDIYLTNVVKHFKWKARGRRRIHDTPNEREVAACRPWMDAEIAAIRPTGLVCLGAIAARALFGRGYRLTQRHGEFVESDLAPVVTASFHPSAVLRGPDPAAKRARYVDLVGDLAAVRRAIEETRQRG